jgi:ribosomal protein S18 acetylase RimI-like enzyme
MPSSAADQGAQQGDLQIEQDNPPALRRYRRVGFQPSHHDPYRIPTP